MRPAVTEDCANCAALCCVALAFDAGESFAIDKPAGTPCPNLAGHACSIHDRLDVQGFSGCVRYSCAGAGQRVTQELFDGVSWRDDPTLLSPMMEAFRGMRAIQDRLVLLLAAEKLSLSPEDQARAEGLMDGLGPEHVTRQIASDFPGSALETEIDGFIRSLSRYVRR
ncbi:hypothetical protein [Pseudooceanicola sp.]|uniref:hypothetical protein n=1 Tax=Pseudooceanicola sp. TaxID=1914328 RepID=UPI0035C6A66C